MNACHVHRKSRKLADSLQSFRRTCSWHSWFCLYDTIITKVTQERRKETDRRTWRHFQMIYFRCETTYENSRQNGSTKRGEQLSKKLMIDLLFLLKHMSITVGPSFGCSTELHVAKRCFEAASAFLGCCHAYSTSIFRGHYRYGCYSKTLCRVSAYPLHS